MGELIYWQSNEDFDEAVKSELKAKIPDYDEERVLKIVESIFSMGEEAEHE